MADSLYSFSSDELFYTPYYTWKVTKCVYIVCFVCFLSYIVFFTILLKKIISEHANKEYISNWKDEDFCAYLSIYIYNMRSAVRNTITINDKIKGTISDSLSALLAKWCIATLYIYMLYRSIVTICVHYDACIGIEDIYVFFDKVKGGLIT